MSAGRRSELSLRNRHGNGIITSNTNDKLNRLTATRSDLSGAPAVTSTTTYKAYDQLGRVLTSEQATNGSGPYGFDYAYDLAGGLTGFTNETTGRTIWTGYNNLDQPTDVSGQVGAGTSTAYVQGVLYAPHGALAQATMNPGSHSWMDAWGYNSSLQVSGISSANGFGLGYTYFADQNVETQTIYRPGKTWSQAYTYDNVNRLKTAAETGQANDWSHELRG